MNIPIFLERKWGRDCGPANAVLPLAGRAIAYDGFAGWRRYFLIVMAGLVPAIHVFVSTEIEDVDARAFAAPKRLRPRRRDKPAHDE